MPADVVAPILSVRDLDVRYGAVRALKDVSLEVNEGELVGLVGPNGAGKSTLLMTIAGVLKPKAGTVDFDGRSVIGDTPERIVRRGDAEVLGDREPREDATALRHERDAAGPARAEDLKSRYEQLYERFPLLLERKNSPAGQLSGGEQQQLAIGRALLSGPKLLLIDEPSLGLAPQIVEKVFDVIDMLKSEGATILLVEQNAIATVQMSDRTYLLSGGRIEMEGSAADFEGREDIFGSVYLGGAAAGRQGEGQTA
jgi:branched-chain amino acid transport system ATP-binding protein